MPISKEIKSHLPGFMTADATVCLPKNLPSLASVKWESVHICARGQSYLHKQLIRLH